MSNKRLRTLKIFMITILLFIVIGLSAQVIMHELTHGQVCRHFGGHERYELSWLKASTYCDGNLTVETWEQIRHYNLLAEIEGYHMMPASLMIAMTIFISVVFICVWFDTRE